MRGIGSFFCGGFLLFGFQGFAQNSLHQFTVSGINGETIDLAIYQGKKLMLVNTASYCQYTPQYTNLENLYAEYKDQGFEILGFPCNDFGGQEPGKDSAIIDFCTMNYSVTFQMMSKVQIATGDTTPLYKWLQKKALNGVSDAKVDWNFNKFLIDECGQWVAYHSSTVLPGSSAITNWITSAQCVVNGIAENEGRFFTRPPQSPVSGQLLFCIAPGLAGHTKIELAGLTGENVLSDLTPYIQENGEVSVDISGLKDGLYFLRLSQGHQISVHKLIITTR
jgi:glutathione peroxidase